jgi:hypothetical protein
MSEDSIPKSVESMNNPYRRPCTATHLTLMRSEIVNKLFDEGKSAARGDRP